MNKPRVEFDDVKKRLMKDQEFKEEYEKIKPRYETISQIIQGRKEMHKSET